MEKLLLNVTLLIFALFCGVCNSENILFFFGISTYSHRIAVWPLVEKLVEGGHNVTFFTPHKNRNPHPNVTELNPKIDFPQPNFLQDRIDKGSWGSHNAVFDLASLGVQLCDQFLSDPKIKEWARNSNYDLIFLDSLYNDCGLGLAFKFGAKHAIFGTSTALDFWPDSFGYPSESSWIPVPHFPYQLPMGIYERVMSTIYPLIFHFQRTYQMFPALEWILKTKLEIPNMPPLQEIQSNTSLILMNTHYSEEVARSLPPMVIPVGGLHCRDEVNPIPKIFTKFLRDGGDKGFIYVSFGSGAQIAKAPRELKDVFFKAMKNSKTKFLWKWEGPRPVNIPTNVLTSDWMPQQDMLGHPDVKGFITHGGLLGIQEAIHHAVPMIVLPIFAEQDYNAQRMHRTGRGIALEIVGLKPSDLENAINKILNDDTYRNNMKALSKRFKDRPAKPLDTAVWWTEYILRHDDTSFLRPLAASQTWYQRRLLDVWLIIFVVIGFGLVLLTKLVKKVRARFSAPAATAPAASNTKNKTKRS